MKGKKSGAQPRRRVALAFQGGGFPAGARRTGVVRGLMEGGAFDDYDSVLCAGPHHVDEIRATEKIGSLPSKQLVEYGYPRLDSILEEAEARLPEYFGRLPRAPVGVERVARFREEATPMAYYRPPPLDGSRPGLFYVNRRSVGEMPTFAMRA